MKHILSAIVLASALLVPSAVLADESKGGASAYATPQKIQKLGKKAALKAAAESYHAALKTAKTTYVDAVKKITDDFHASLKAATTKEQRMAAKDVFKKAMKDANAARKTAEKAAHETRKAARAVLK